HEREELRNTFTEQFSLVKNTNAELRTELQRLQEQQQALNKQQQALNETVKQGITVGLEDIRQRLLQTSFKEMMLQIPESLKSDLRKVLEEATDDTVSKIQNQIETWLTRKYPESADPQALTRRVEEALYRVSKTAGMDDVRAKALVQLALQELAAKQN